MEQLQLPPGMTIEVKTPDGKVTPIMSIDELKKKAGEVYEQRKRAALAAEAQKQKEKEEQERCEYLCKLLPEVYSAMLHTTPVDKLNHKDLKDLHTQFEFFVNNIFLPYALPGHKAIITIRQTHELNINGELWKKEEHGLCIHIVPTAQWEGFVKQFHKPAQTKLVNKTDEKKILKAIDGTPNTPKKTKKVSKKK